MNEFWKDEPTISSELEDVGSLIHDAIDRSHSFVRQLLSAQVKTNGKMLRPALVLIGSRLGDPARRDGAKKIASVLEMIHMASLVHDDIIDDARTRRGLPTLYAQAGAKQAVLAGDYLLSRAMALVGGREGDLEASTVSNAFSRLCESELDQDAGQGDFTISTNTYMRRIAGKTASLFALSSYAGAAVAKADACAQRKMHRIGYLMGMAFQIQDDILDYDGHAEKLGKEPGRDILNGIPTLPLLAALKKEKVLPVEEQLLHQITAKQKISKRDAAKAVKRVVQLGGLQEAKGIAGKYADRATHDIRSLGHDEVERILLWVFDRLSGRRT
ncbi:MAG: polyprenyl synthetase family protein [Sphaerochaetaceae bacterium]|jgi:heptaprenyl diphosphate synthase|nr:polyprenyl synthetase family protein [Sphaerochaetaceae bacterium]MDD3942275.1 polyprenyl synthetase family protein [Sphaerochaetaceae bacterium]MDX9939959.1 polyprenyl synthetase family protein [Sphaerochaetaceae bacterium]